MISVSCSCGRKFKADDHHAGKRTKCPVCGSMLVIGPAPVTSSTGVSDNGEVPSWWFPSSSSPRPAMPLPPREPPPPTRSGSNPDDIQTAVVPTQAAVPTQPLSSDQTKAVPPAQPSVLAKGNTTLILGMIAGSLIVCAFGVALIIWLQIAREPELSKSELVAKGNRLDQELDEASPRKSQQTPEPSEQPGQALTAPTPKLQLLVPAYFYPAGPGLQAWQRLINAAPKIKMVVIANPDNGPGLQHNPDYDPIFNAANARGIRVIGYVSTGYGKFSVAEVKRAIDKWLEFYPKISGFFVDQQSAEAQDVPFYLQIRDHARRKLKDALMVNNPGTICDESYFARDVSDVTCIFTAFDGFDQFNLPARLWQYSPSRFAALTYQVSDVRAMRQVISNSSTKHIGYLYISDAPKGSNPWAQLPHYWDEEVEAAANNAN